MLDGPAASWLKSGMSYTDANRANWDDRAAIHLRDATGFYRLDAFRAGEDVLNPIEAAEIGDVAGRRLVHLQCHFGLDSLSLARRGAAVTGIDFSSVAIAGARRLADETGIAARFVEGDVLAARDLVEGQFDIAYATWGTITWLPDIRRWAATVAALLAPGGFLYLADAHPAALAFEQVGDALVLTHPWHTAPDRPLVFDGPETYTGDATPLAHPRTYEWAHPLSAIIGGLLDAGLRLEFLHEHEEVPWRIWPLAVPAGHGLYRLPGHLPAMPLAFSLKAAR